VDYRH